MNEAHVPLCDKPEIDHTIDQDGAPSFDNRRSGFVAVFRNMRSHWLVGAAQPVKPANQSLGSYSRFEAWVDLIKEATFAPRGVRIGGWATVLRRGQLMASVSWLARRWNSTIKTVRVFLEKLESDAMIWRDACGPEKSMGRGKHAAIITIQNYEAYQSLSSGDGQGARQLKGTKRASKGRARGNKYNKEKNEITEQHMPVAQCGPEHPSGRVEVLAAFHAYNELARRCVLPEASRLTADFEQKVAAVLKEFGLEGWHKALAEVEQSAFLTGLTENGFRADLEFLTRPDKFMKIHDGGYRKVSARAEQRKLSRWGGGK